MQSDPKMAEVAALVAQLKAERHNPLVETFYQLVRLKLDVIKTAMVWTSPADLPFAQGRAQGLAELLNAMERAPLQEQLAKSKARLNEGSLA